MKRNLTQLLGLFCIACSSGVFAQAPTFTSNFYNPCGNDGNNEFLVGKAAATAAFDPLKLSYFVSGANPDGSGRDSIYQDAFCSSLTATGSGSNACNAAGWTRSAGVGSGSYRILDYTNAADRLRVDSVIARLNYRLASCASGSCGNTFIAPPSATGLIPANAKFIFCISQGINDTASSAGAAVDFCGFCGAGPFYVVVASFPPGASGLLTNTYTATTSRYISFAYDYGGATGIAESQSYIHVPSSSSVGGRNYLQMIPQGAGALANNIALNDNTLDCAISAGTALPVSLTSFTGKYDNGAALLHWSTASEQGTDRFDVERSLDAHEFVTVGSVTASGYTITATDYNFSDRFTLNGTAYYRLRQLDKDGKHTYSAIIPLTASSAEQVLNVWPNPARDQVQLTIFSASYNKALLMLISTAGRVSYQAEELLSPGVNPTTLPVDNLAPGAYYLRVQTDQSVYNKVIIKQ